MNDFIINDCYDRLKDWKNDSLVVTNSVLSPIFHIIKKII
jgi:hypothetical protein